VYEHVLLPVAPESVATDAIPHAKRLAQPTDATVHVVSAVDVPPGSRSASWSDAATRRIESSSERRVESVTRTLEAAGVDTDGTIVCGDPRRVIANAINDVVADVVVMPTHARTGLERFLLGSITAHVVRTAPVPVCTVPIRDTEA
jgi:nucleotide-binding universal stress UspA family protein